MFIQNELFERFRGDGLMASTPTGSTAHKANGGAVMHPSLQAIQLAETQLQLIVVFSNASHR